MSQTLYMDDSYCKHFTATVQSVTDNKFVVLDKTAFYPTGGGQPHDTGVMKAEDGTEYEVVYVGKFNGAISHEVAAAGLKEGDIVECTLNWDRRYQLMRAHTAAHILSAVIHKETGALITGNQLALDKVRVDLSLENFDRDQIKQFEATANKALAQDMNVHTAFMARSDAEKDPTLFKLAKGIPPAVTQLRIVDIGDGFDRQACGGTHVARSGEIGPINITKAENKGKQNRRIYFSLTQ